MTCRDKCKDDLQDLLDQLKDNCEQVTLTIQSGSQCCKQTGCICDVDDCFVVLIDTNDTCQRTYIALDSICAVKNCVEDECDKC